MKFCPYCAADVLNGDKFCRYCGASLLVEQVKKQRSFSYSTHGMMFNSGFDIKVTENDGKLTATYRHTFVSPENAKSFEVDDAFFEKIEEIILSRGGYNWDGFSGHAQGVMDGDSFSFYFTGKNGRSISANGYMAWPAGLNPAIAEIKALFDEVYEVRFPNLYKIFETRLNEELQKEFGDSPYYGIKSGDIVTQIPYVYGDPGFYNWGENPMPEGVFCQMVYCGYEGRDEANPGYRAVVVLIAKEKAEDSAFKFTNIKFRYYGMEPDLQIRLIEQFTVCREIVIGNSGFYGIFHFGSPAETTIGVFTENDWSAGDRKQRFSLTGFKLSKDEMKECGRTTVTVSREEDKMTEESIDALCNQAEKCGFGFIAISWKNEWRAKGTISRPLMTFLVNLTWSSIKNGQMLDNADGTLNGTPIEGWHVNVFRR